VNFDDIVPGTDSRLSRIPRVYRPPVGGPLRWQDDVTGVLPAAVKAFFADQATPEQLEQVCDYCEYYINAPCWLIGPDDEALWVSLRKRIKTAKTAMEIRVWLHDALGVTIDPF
jgi:hypothetical protein